MSAVRYGGYTLHYVGGLWHVYESLVEIAPGTPPGAAPHPRWIDRTYALDLARHAVRRHRERATHGARP